MKAQRKALSKWRLSVWMLILLGAWGVISGLLNGCSGGSSCPNPNTLSGFVYIRQGALAQAYGTLEHDVLVTDSPNLPTGYEPLKGAKVTVEETGASLVLGEKGAFVFYPLAAGTYTLVIQVEGFPPVRRTKSVCAETTSTYYFSPPFYDPTPPLTTPSPPKPATPPPDTSGIWNEGGLSSWGEGGEASARKR